jgi:hypothetical protein
MDLSAIKTSRSNLTKSPVMFFGYWSGTLPPVTELHFRSFIHYHPESFYDLWLDADMHSSLSLEMNWLKDHPQIRIRDFSLQTLIDHYVHPKQPAKNQPNVWHEWLRKQHKRKIFRKINLQSWVHPAIGITYKHSSRLFKGFTHNLAYRGDLARCLIPVEYYRQPSVYVDLDICFLSNLLDLCQGSGFAYRWEEFTFANSAVLFTPNLDAAKAIIAKGNEIETFIPWHLFTDEICAKLNIHIHPTNLFDPGWDRSSLLRNDVGLFFKNSSQSAAIVDELFAKAYRVNHWHNHWKTIPENASPYQLLLERFKGHLKS